MHLDPGHLLTFGELKSILGSDVHPRLEIVNDPIKHEQKLVENLSVVDWGGGWFEGGMVTANFLSASPNDIDKPFDVQLGSKFQGSLCGVRIGDPFEKIAEIANREAQPASPAPYEAGWTELYSYSPGIHHGVGIDWIGWELEWHLDGQQKVANLRLFDAQYRIQPQGQ